MGPIYACPFAEYVDQLLFQCYAVTVPHLFLCYIDDCFSAASGDRHETGICFKPTDSHSYLDYTSPQPPSCKNAIPYCQFFCLCHVCSQNEAIHSCTSQMPSYFMDHNLPPSVGMSILGCLQCHNDATHKLEEQHLIFCLGS
eukprot:g41841.t1